MIINTLNYNSLGFGINLASLNSSFLEELKNEKGFHLNVVCTELSFL